VSEFEPEQDVVTGGEGEQPSPPEGDLEHYDGQWVAVRDGVVVASDPDEARLRADPAVRDGDDVYPIGEPPSGFYFLEGTV
jgi:hypothetical protein